MLDGDIQILQYFIIFSDNVNKHITDFIGIKVVQPYLQIPYPQAFSAAPQGGFSVRSRPYLVYLSDDNQFPDATGRLTPASRSIFSIGRLLNRPLIPGIMRVRAPVVAASAIFR